MMAAGDIVEQLQNRLECAICLGVYEDPRSLPCLHTFCKKCLQHLPLVEDGQNHSVSCPTCRKSSPLPPNGVEGFPVSFHIVQLLDFVKNKKELINGGGGGAKEEIVKKCEHCPSVKSLKYCWDCQVDYCRECAGMHKECNQPQFNEGAVPMMNNFEQCLMHKRPLDMYCERCEDIICTSCTKKWPHSEHTSSCIPITRAVATYKNLLTDKFIPLRKQIDLMTTQLKDITRQESEIAQQSKTIKADIHSTAEFLIKKIESSEKNLADKVDQVINSKLDAIAVKREAIETTHEELKNLKENMELCLSRGNNSEILKTTKRWIPNINQMIESVDTTLLQPCDVADLSFLPDKVDDTFSNLGNLSASLEGGDTRVNIRLIDQFIFVNQSSEVSLIYFIQYTTLPYVMIPLSSIKVMIQPPPSAHSVKVLTSNRESPHHYNIKFQPTSNGSYKIDIQIGDICTETQSLFIPFHPLYLPQIIPTGAMKNLQRPFALEVTKDKKIILISDCKEIMVYDCFGGHSSTYSSLDKGGGFFVSSQHRFTALRHVAITPDDCLLVADAHCILKLSLDFKLIATIGKKGTGPLQFDTIFCIAVNQNNGQIYICDLNNHRIQVLNPDLTFSNLFGQKGSESGQFSQPNGLALDCNGDVFVTDTFNHRIQKFSHKGEFQFHFGSQGSEEGQLNLPEKIVVNSNYIYVSEHNNSRISVFTTKGEFVRCFGRKESEGGLQWPRGITMDKEGSLYVCDYQTQRIVKY